MGSDDRLWRNLNAAVWLVVGIVLLAVHSDTLGAAAIVCSIVWQASCHD